MPLFVETEWCPEEEAITCGVDIGGKREEKRPLRVARLGGEVEKAGENRKSDQNGGLLIFTQATWQAFC